MITETIKSNELQRIHKIFEAQGKTIHQLRLSTVAQRIEKLKGLEKLILKYQDKLGEGLFKDFAKSDAETKLTEIFSMLTEVRHAIKHIRAWMRPRRVGTPMALLGTTSKIYYEAKGIALIIAPWNYPYSLAINPLISAIAAGNCAIVKPSELTPNASAVLSEMIRELFAEEEVAVVEGGVEVSTALLALPFNHIFFTGSPAIGKVVMKAAAEHLTSVTLELGGKSPVIVDDSANIKDTAEKLAWAKFTNAGQTCVAPDYVLVKAEKRDELVEELRKSIQRMYNANGAGIDQSKDYTHIVNHRHYTRLNKLLDDAVSKGATVAAGGKLNVSDKFIEPTVLTNVTPDMEVMQEEIFGPLLPVMPYTNTSEAIDFINQREKPLALYIFSRDKEATEKLVRRTSAGGTCINDCMIHLGHPDLPFGGVNNSGIGKSHGFFGFQEFSNIRPVLRQRVGLTSIKMLYPPYTPKIKKLINLLLKWS